MVMLLTGACSAVHALRIGWNGWALYITIANVIVNVYPILLQRYTRGRIVRVPGGD